MDERSWVGRSVLVTGATGFLGTHLVRELIHRGGAVHCIRRSPNKSTRLPCPEIVWHQADLTDAGALRKAVVRSQPEVVYHLAAHGTVYGGNDEAGAFDGNVVGTWNLWQALEGCPARLVYTGSCGEYGPAKGQVREDHVCRPESFYPATKNAATVLLSTLGKRSGREVVVLRPFGAYGPADNAGRVVPHTIQKLLAGETVKVTAGEQLRDYCYVDDHVAALVAAGDKPLAESGRIYNIGSGTVIHLRALLETIAQAVGGDAPRRIALGAIPYRPDEAWEMCCDVAAARKDLDFQPRVELTDGVARTVEWYRREASS